MTTEMALAARRFALTLAVAGMAGLGSIAVAPAASAASDTGPGYTVVHTNVGNGPDAFLVHDHGVRQPIFFCDPETPKKQRNTCTASVTSATRF